MKTLLLWDIDGTLITARGAGLASLSVAVRNAFGIEHSLKQLDLYGRTDRWIFRQILQLLQLPVTETNVRLLEENYLIALPSCIAEKSIELLPGIQEILDEASQREDVIQGLLTGNLRRGAEIKLSTRGIWSHFPFGAFADDSEDRNELGPHALRRAREHHGFDVPIDRVWIIGDTPHDVTCGKVIGARTLAVATGRHTVGCLQESKPDAVIANCADTGAFWKTVLRN